MNPSGTAIRSALRATEHCPTGASTARNMVQDHRLMVGRKQPCQARATESAIMSVRFHVANVSGLTSKGARTVPQVTIRITIEGREETLSEYLCDWAGCPNVAVEVLGIVRELSIH